MSPWGCSANVLHYSILAFHSSQDVLRIESISHNDTHASAIRPAHATHQHAHFMVARNRVRHYEPTRPTVRSKYKNLHFELPRRSDLNRSSLTESRALTHGSLLHLVW